ncbi:hypothetical protein HY213_00910 [Candidatus Peregrinibacteria bacterium]|nr:hypothetical protein [Candidatus Peregrinibacteria bacterium]
MFGNPDIHDFNADNVDAGSHATNQSRSDHEQQEYHSQYHPSDELKEREHEDAENIIPEEDSSAEYFTSTQLQGSERSGNEILPLRQESALRKLENIGRTIEERIGPEKVSGTLFKKTNELKFDFMRSAGVSCVFKYRSDGKNARVSVEYRFQGRNSHTIVLPDLESWDINDFMKVLNQNIKKVEQRTDTLKIVDDTKEYESVQSRQLALEYRNGKREEALAFGRKWGLEVVKESPVFNGERLGNGITFRWPRNSTTKEKQTFLNAVKAKQEMLRIVEPNYPQKLDR